MGKISLYLLFLILYLGIYKSFIGFTHGNVYLESTYDITKFIPYSRYSVLLNEASSRGYFIKSYYLTYKIYLPYEKVTQTLRFEVDKDFFYSERKKTGLSVLRKINEKKFENTASIPGILYVNDKNFGKWIVNNSGNKEWRFHYTNKNLYKLFKWSDYRPNFKEYKTFKYYISKKININKQTLSFLKSDTNLNKNYFGLNLDSYFSKIYKKLIKLNSNWKDRHELDF